MVLSCHAEPALYRKPHTKFKNRAGVNREISSVTKWEHDHAGYAYPLGNVHSLNYCLFWNKNPIAVAVGMWTCGTAATKTATVIDLRHRPVLDGRGMEGR